MSLSEVHGAVKRATVPDWSTAIGGRIASLFSIFWFKA